MRERTKNILTIGLSVACFVLFVGVMMLAGELRGARAMEESIASIKAIEQKIQTNSLSYEQIEEQKKVLAQRQIELHELNNSLRAQRQEVQTQFLSGL